MDITKVHTRRKEEEEGRKEKDGPLIRLGPRRPALLIGKIWECIGTLGIYYGLDQGFMLGSGGGGGRKEGRRKAATLLVVWTLEGWISVRNLSFFVCRKCLNVVSCLFG